MYKNMVKIKILTNLCLQPFLELTSRDTEETEENNVIEFLIPQHNGIIFSIWLIVKPQTTVLTFLTNYEKNKICQTKIGF